MVNILFCGNDKVFDGMLTCALSIMKRSESKEPYRFFVYTMDVSHLRADFLPVSGEQIAFFSEVIKSYNPANEVDLIDVSDIYAAEFAGCPNETAYCSPYTLIRLFADIVAGMPDKLLYLDADVLFNRDIHLLYDRDIEGYEYAAAREHYGKFLVRPDYINAGMLLLNIPEIKKTGLLRKARELIKTKKLMFADQDAVFRSTTRKMLLPQRFNDQKFLHKHTVLRHFSKRLFWFPYPHTANIKQWHVTKVHKVFGYDQFDDILYEYIYLIEKFNREVKK